MTAPTSRKSNPDPAGPGENAVDEFTPSPGELRAFALQLLARRDYGEQELASRLAAKWPGVAGLEPRLDALITQLIGEGLLSDQRFAEGFVRSRRRRAQGPLKIRAELQRRRVDAAIVAESLAEGDEDWTRRALEWLMRQCPGELDYAARGKYYRRLVSRGFSHTQAMDALSRHAEQRTDEPPRGN
jgi:regulatory protein